eukprot:m.527215 g.527215  ORF g.527215 m.527215 type:complete len:129 (+) comp22009_c1_seq20:332-718(+)
MGRTTGNIRDTKVIAVDSFTRWLCMHMYGQIDAVNDRTLQTVVDHLEDLFNIADEYQGLIDMGYIGRKDMYALEPYFQAIVSLENDMAMKYVQRTRVFPERVVKFLENTPKSKPAALHTAADVSTQVF